MTDLELQRRLAELLPEKIMLRNGVYREFIPTWKNILQPVQETEWLHVCWLIEQGMDYETWCLFRMELGEIVKSSQVLNWITPYNYVSASWQQRARAILAAKGIKK